MATRVTDGARRERLPPSFRARALLSLNLEKKRDCSQSISQRKRVEMGVKDIEMGSIYGKVYNQII